MKKLQSSLLLLLFFSLALSSKAQSQKQNFQDSFNELKAMLEGEEPVDFERAVYLSESPFWDSSYNYQDFQAVLDSHQELIQLLVDQYTEIDSLDFGSRINGQGVFEINDIRYSPAEKKQLYKNVLNNWAIFTYLSDTINYFGLPHYPFQYASQDPFGKKDWSNSQLMGLLQSSERKGNCYALTALFKILANRLETDAKLCTAPQHIYIQHADEKGNLYNVELATAGHPTDGQLQTLTHLPSAAIKNGIALRRYSEKESIGLCLVNLAKAYEHAAEEPQADFILECAELALKYDAKNLNALLLKQQFLDNRLIEYARKYDLKEIKQLKAAKETAQSFADLQALLQQLNEWHYKPMPLAMQKMILQGYSQEEVSGLKEKNKNPKPFTSIEPLDEEDGEYLTLSNGLFTEVHAVEENVRYGHFVLNSPSQKITALNLEEQEEELIDPVAFAYNFGARMYDASVGRWLSRDPLANEFPWQSPYVGFDNNPILYIDPDGKAVIPANDDSKIAFQSSIIKVFGINEVGNAVGDLLISHMNYVNTLDPNTGVSLDGEFVSQKKFKKSVKKAVKNGVLSKDLATQANSLFEVINNNNQNYISVEFADTDFRDGSMTFADFDLPDFFNSHRVPKEAKKILRQEGIVTFAAGGRKPGFGASETGSITILNSFNVTNLNELQMNLIFKGVIEGDKLVSKSP